jgi:hypothetical protein
VRGCPLHVVSKIKRRYMSTLASAITALSDVGVQAYEISQGAPVTTATSSTGATLVTTGTNISFTILILALIVGAVVIALVLLKK